LPHTPPEASHNGGRLNDYRSCGLWLDTAGDELRPRPTLGSDAEFDVAIVGAGYTGLWTAYYLSRADPSLRIAVLEKEIAGFGASGRNGGWCSALFAASKDRLAANHGREAALAMQRELFDTVDEVGRVIAAEGIDAHYAKGGSLALATAPAHMVRIRSLLNYERSWGFGEEDYRWLDAAETAHRVTVQGCRGSVYTPHCAALHPARLARGLATVVERRGVKLFESTEVVKLQPRRLSTAVANVKAEVAVRATEGYTPALPGLKRVLAPLYSLMIATEPLGDAFWREVGWSRRETITDGRHLIIYAQRTGDGRIAFGGRGAPYHFASRVEDRFDREPRVFADLRRVMCSLFPRAIDAAITHQWGGPLGVPRDWHSSVGFDRRTGLAWAGGYVGDGVATANLAGRTLADLIMGRDTGITRLPWVGHRWRRWEPEPLRWLGINLSLKAMASADRSEARTGRPARRADLVKRLVRGE
jgi:glycine/D-amino acid oxidase-like deaminating enzyme